MNEAKIADKGGSLRRQRKGQQRKGRCSKCTHASWMVISLTIYSSPLYSFVLKGKLLHKIPWRIADLMIYYILEQKYNKLYVRF